MLQPFGEFEWQQLHGFGLQQQYALFETELKLLSRSPAEPNLTVLPQLFKVIPTECMRINLLQKHENPVKNMKVRKNPRDILRKFIHEAEGLCKELLNSTQQYPAG